MTAPPLVSCVVPVFNGARFIEEAIASIEAQTWRPIEIIVVDDGSTDETPCILAGMGDRIRVLRQDNAGPAAARNRGVEVATGAFIAFLDADDQWLPEKLAVQMARLRDRPDLDVSLCQVKHWWIPELQHEADTLAATLDGAMIGISVAVIRRGLFDRAGLLDESFRHMDCTEWLMRVRDVSGVLEILPDTLVLRRIHHDNMSRSRGGEDADERLRVARKRLMAGRKAAGA